MTEMFHPIVSDADMPEDVAHALMLLQVEYSDKPETVLTENQVREFLSATSFPNVADKFKDFYLFFAA